MAVIVLMGLGHSLSRLSATKNSPLAAGFAMGVQANPSRPLGEVDQLALGVAKPGKTGEIFRVAAPKRKHRGSHNLSSAAPFEAPATT